MPGHSEQDEYLEQNEEERERASRRNALIALVVLAALVIAGLALVERLRDVSAVQDCLMTRATNCGEISPPPPVASGRPSGPSTTR